PDAYGNALIAVCATAGTSSAVSTTQAVKNAMTTRTAALYERCDRGAGLSLHQIANVGAGDGHDSILAPTLRLVERLVGASDEALHGVAGREFRHAAARRHPERTAVRALKLLCRELGDNRHQARLGLLQRQVGREQDELVAAESGQEVVCAGVR